MLAADSRGRLEPEEECEIRTCFQRDVDRITHSKSFRRLKHKTQVFLQPEGDHYRTRLTHTLEVTRLARTVARALRLNEDLAEAIALGHDLGHTPFGHAGERALNASTPAASSTTSRACAWWTCSSGTGEGLNLCYETRMGILNHTHGAPDDTREATAVRLCDRIAYINHDLDDSIRAGILTAEDVPERIRRECGERNSERINSLITDLIQNSGGGVLRMSPEMQETFDFLPPLHVLRRLHQPHRQERGGQGAGHPGEALRLLCAHPEALPEDCGVIAERDGRERAAVDYISGMTDGYAMEKYGEVFIPFAWTVK